MTLGEYSFHQQLTRLPFWLKQLVSVGNWCQLNTESKSLPIKLIPIPIRLHQQLRLLLWRWRCLFNISMSVEHWLAPQNCSSWLNCTTTGTVLKIKSHFEMPKYPPSFTLLELLWTYHRDNQIGISIFPSSWSCENLEQALTEATGSRSWPIVIDP